MIKAKGRMINQDISRSKKVAKLSGDALILFVMLIPHWNAHGKMAAGAGHIKDTVVPLIDRITQKKIPKLLEEISEHTSVKYFHDEKGLPHLHSLNFSEHQPGLREDRKGPDYLPDFSNSYSSLPDCSRSGAGAVPPEVEGKVEVEVEVEVEAQHDETAELAPGLTTFELPGNQPIIKALKESNYLKPLAVETELNANLIDSLIGLEQTNPGFRIIKEIAKSDVHIAKKPSTYRFASQTDRKRAASGARSFFGGWCQRAIRYLEDE